MKVLSPFGPKIAKLKLSSNLIKKLNKEVEKIISKKNLVKKLDYSSKLVGQVKQEFQIPKSFIKKNLEKIIFNEVKKYIFKCLGKKISKIKHENNNYTLSSIIKTHHPSYVFNKLFDNPDVIFLYIYRKPIDVFISFRNFIENWNWHEGPKTNTLLEFIKSPPEGQMQRYQKHSYNNLFERWANHVLNWINTSLIKNNVFIVNYNDLDKNFDNELKKIFEYIKIEYNLKTRPERDSYIQTVIKKYDESDYFESKNFITEYLQKYPLLKKLFCLIRYYLLFELSFHC